MGPLDSLSPLGQSFRSATINGDGPCHCPALGDDEHLPERDAVLGALLPGKREARHSEKGRRGAPGQEP